MMLLNIAAALLLGVPSVQDASSYSIKVTSPEPGTAITYYSWEPNVSLEVVAPPGDYELELTYRGVTHFLPAFEPLGRPIEGGLARWSLRDSWLPLERGDHPLRLRLRSLETPGLDASGRLLAEIEVPLRFDFRSDDPPAKAGRDITLRFCWEAIDTARNIDSATDPHGLIDTGDPERRDELALRWLESKHRWLFARIKALAGIAELHDYSGRPGDALEALRRAEAIWHADSAENLNRPPASAHPIKWHTEGFTPVPHHLKVFAGFYARRMEFDRALAYQKKAIAFLDEQLRKNPGLDADDRKHGASLLGSSMRDVARMHYFLRRDRAGYDLWIQRSRDALPPPENRSGGLLGR
jgi:hypothetical protein